MATFPRRILYVEGNVDGTIGGSYFSLLFLVSGLDKARYEPLVVFAAETALAPRFHAADIRTMVRPMASPYRLSGPAGELVAKVVNFLQGHVLEPARLAAMLRRERIDLVHLNNSILRNHPWMLAARIARIPCITHERGINAHFSRRARWLASGLKAIVCISAAVHANFESRGLANLPLVTIHNGLDAGSVVATRPADAIRAELGIQPEHKLVGIIGNIKPWKGQDVVVRALGLLRDEIPNVTCLLVGDTSPGDVSYREEIESLIKELGLGGRVIVTGYRSDVANYIAALEIQIHASIDPEPFGRVLLEGMALSKPLIASNAGAVPEIVVHGKTGLLFEPGQSEALAAAVRSLLIDPALAAFMGRAGRERVLSEFSIGHNVHETQTLYDKLLAH